MGSSAKDLLALVAGTLVLVIAAYFLVRAGGEAGVAITGFLGIAAIGGGLLWLDRRKRT